MLCVGLHCTTLLLIMNCIDVLVDPMIKHHTRIPYCFLQHLPNRKICMCVSVLWRTEIKLQVKREAVQLQNNDRHLERLEFHLSCILLCQAYSLLSGEFCFYVMD